MDADVDADVSADVEAGAAREKTTSFTVCSNCGDFQVQHFCPRCGQEQGPAVPTVEQVWAEVGDSLFGYDSRLVRTIRGLLRPGFLTLEYLRGRRADYITPFRLYLLISAVYIFLNLTLTNIEKSVALPAPTPAATESEKPAASPTPAPTPLDVAASENKEATGDEKKDSASDNEKEAAKDKAEAIAAAKEAKKAEREKKTADKAEESKGGFRDWAGRHESLATLLVLPLFAGLLYRSYRVSHPLFIGHLVFALHLQCISYVLAIVLVIAPSLINDIFHALNIPILKYLTALIANVGIVVKFAVLFFYLRRAVRVVYGEEHGKALRTTLFLFLSLLFLTAIQGRFFGLLDDIVPGASLARFLPD